MYKCISVSIVVYFTLLLVLESSAQSAGRSKAKSKDKSLFDQSFLGKAQKVVCDNRSEERLDVFAHKLVSSRFPTNARELRQFCNAGIKGAGFVLGFAKHCLSEFAKKAIQVVFHPLTNELQQICRSGRMSPKAKVIINAAVCGNAARPGLRKCYHRFIDKGLSIHNSTNNKLKIPMLCCEFNVLRECFKTEAEEVKICTKRTVDYIERYALELFGEILNLMCYDYQDSSDKCNKVIREIPKIDLTGVKRPRSFVPPMLQILQDIGEDF